MQAWDKIHIEGMGWYGSLIAHELALRDIPFTWNDFLNADPWLPTAWQASSGLIYPSGDDQSAEGYELWAAAYNTGKFGQHLSRSRFWYNTKSLPNGLPGKPVRTYGPFNCSPFPAYSVNVSAWVRLSREIFGRNRTSAPVTTGRTRLIKAHSHAYRYAWGWTAPAVVSFAGTSLQSADTFYMRASRFKLAYAVYRQSSPDHIIGSDHIATTKPHEYPLEFVLGKVRDWQTLVRRVSEGHLDCALTGPAIQGWRPLGDGTSMIGRYDNGDLRVPGMGSSGVRHGLLVLRDIMANLGQDITLKLTTPESSITYRA